MAKLSAHGKEIARYLSAKHRGLCAVHEDGVTLIKTPWTGWKVLYRVKAGADLKAWKEEKLAIIKTLPKWQQVDSIPSLKALQKMSFDGVAETVTGCLAEPDGFGSDGSPAWTLFFRLL